MLVDFMRSVDMRSLAQTYTYTYTIMRFFPTSVYAYLTLTAHPTTDLHDGRTRIFDGGRVIMLSRRKISPRFIS